MDDSAPGIDLELALTAASLAQRVEVRPLKKVPHEDWAPSAVYEGSGKTLGLRIKKLGLFKASFTLQPDAEGLYAWHIWIEVGAYRRTHYTAWLKEQPAQVAQILANRKLAKELRQSLPHAQRKKRPWGIL